MIESLSKVYNIAKQWSSANGHRLATLEGPRDCNRSCRSCAVPMHYDRDTEMTVSQICQAIDWVYLQGYRNLSHLGGELLIEPNVSDLYRFVTKEGMTFFEQTLKVINYAARKGMGVNVTTNGDYVDDNKIQALKHAGLDTLTFSLHSYTPSALQHLIKCAKLAAEAGIVPTIHAVFTSENAEQLPIIAYEVARHGIFFGIGLVQEKGNEFSTQPQGLSLVPSIDQQKTVFQALLRLKMFGLVRNSKSYLSEAEEYYPNDWQCNQDNDPFIYIGADGRLGVCSDIRTDLHVADISTLDSGKWRDIKRAKIKSCGNCLYHCYYELENPELVWDIPMVSLGLCIVGGHADLAKKWGNYVVNAINEVNKNH